jgi:hypothetical protein
MAPPGRADRLKRISGPIVAGGLGVVLILSLMGLGGPSRRIETNAVLSSEGRSPSNVTRPSSPLPAWWPHHLTLYTDSVGLGAVTALREEMPGWRVKVMGRPALMLDDAADGLEASGDPVDKVVVVAMGYNSLWERHREDFDYWSNLFDHDAARLVRTIHAAGGRKIVWVTLRDAPPSAIPKDAMKQNSSFAWYFPYVNERLELLDRERSDVALADWSRIGDDPDVTYDAIHLDPDGAVVYARMVRRAVMKSPYQPLGS